MTSGLRRLRSPQLFHIPGNIKALGWIGKLREGKSKKKVVVNPSKLLPLKLQRGVL